MRADSHPGPEPKRSTSEVLYIDAALTFVDLGIPPCYARPGHTLWHDSEMTNSAAHFRLQARTGHFLINAAMHRPALRVGRLTGEQVPHRRRMPGGVSSHR